MANAWPHPSQDRAQNDVVEGGGIVDDHVGSIPFHPDSLTIDQLRASAATDPRDLASVLSGITMAALTLTEATGAALALETEGSMICCARAGETAPPLGTALNLNSGISGECLRTGTPQLCSDAWTDPRVDAEASRWLGVRSLAAVPLHNQSGVIGILEIFSDRPNVFSDSHTSLLEQLAEVAVASTGQPFHSSPAEPVATEHQPATISSATILSRLSQKWASLISHQSPGRWATFAAAALVLFGGLGWIAFRTLHRTPSGSSARNTRAASPGIAGNAAAASAETIAADTNGRDVALTRKPTPAIGMSANDLVMQASNVAARERSRPLLVVPSAGPPEPTGQNAANSADNPAPPEVSHLVADPQNNSVEIPAGILTPSAPLPLEQAEISQGVTGGALLHRVTPNYPPQARVQGIEGIVVLRGIIAENGTLRDLRVVSGDPILAFAAKQAVSQWRYSPYRLNGKPVKLSTDITIEFKLPHESP